MTIHRKTTYTVFATAHRAVDGGYESFGTDFDHLTTDDGQVLIRLGGLFLSAEDLRTLSIDAQELQLVAEHERTAEVSDA